MAVLSPGCMAGDYVNGGEEERRKENEEKIRTKENESDLGRTFPPRPRSVLFAK